MKFTGVGRWSVTHDLFVDATRKMKLGFIAEEHNIISWKDYHQSSAKIKVILKITRKQFLYHPHIFMDPCRAQCFRTWDIDCWTRAHYHFNLILIIIFNFRWVRSKDSPFPKKIFTTDLWCRQRHLEKCMPYFSTVFGAPTCMYISCFISYHLFTFILRLRLINLFCDISIIIEHLNS